MGRCALVSDKEAGWLCGTGSAILRLKPGARPEFIALVISSPTSRRYPDGSFRLLCDLNLLTEREKARFASDPLLAAMLTRRENASR
jgi:hypothetical protein